MYHEAKKIPKLAFEEMLEMSSTGAKVLHTRSVELAMKNNLVLQVLIIYYKKTGTFIVDDKKLIEKEIVSGVSYSKNESKITISVFLINLEYLHKYLVYSIKILMLI